MFRTNKNQCNRFRFNFYELWGFYFTKFRYSKYNPIVIDQNIGWKAKQLMAGIFRMDILTFNIQQKPFFFQRAMTMIKCLNNSFLTATITKYFCKVCTFTMTLPFLNINFHFRKQINVWNLKTIKLIDNWSFKHDVVDEN